MQGWGGLPGKQGGFSESEEEKSSNLDGENEEVKKAKEHYLMWRDSTWGKNSSVDKPSKVNIAIATLMNNKSDLCKPEPTKESMRAKTLVSQAQGEEGKEIITLVVKLEEIIRSEARINYASKISLLIEEQHKRTLENREYQNKEMNKVLEDIENQTMEKRKETETLAANWIIELIEKGDQEAIKTERIKLTEKAENLKNAENNEKAKVMAIGIENFRQTFLKTEFNEMKKLIRETEGSVEVALNDFENGPLQDLGTMDQKFQWRKNRGNGLIDKETKEIVGGISG